MAADKFMLNQNVTTLSGFLRAAVVVQRSVVSCSSWPIRGQQTESTCEHQQQKQQQPPVEPVRVRAVCFKLFILSPPLGRD